MQDRVLQLRWEGQAGQTCQGMAAKQAGEQKRQDRRTDSTITDTFVSHRQTERQGGAGQAGQTWPRQDRVQAEARQAGG